MFGEDYYLNEDGAMTEDDWINIDGEDYFFGKNGKMYRNGVYAIAGDNYLFESDGTLAVGDLIRNFMILRIVHMLFGQMEH